jgi:hypothetical protein
MPIETTKRWMSKRMDTWLKRYKLYICTPALLVPYPDIQYSWAMMRWPYIVRGGECTDTRKLGIPKGLTCPYVLYTEWRWRVIAEWLRRGGSQKRIAHSFGGTSRDCYNQWVQTNETQNVMPVRNIVHWEPNFPNLCQMSTNIPTYNFSAISRICRKGRGQYYLWYRSL